jgi:hypothetical protein
MATSEDRVAALEAAIDAAPGPEIFSAEEMERHEAARFADVFGFAAPRFRTVVRIRFHGDGVKGHDLRGSAAGEVIARFTEAVKAAGTKIKDAAPGDLELFLSPTVAPGSTVLELYGAERSASAAPTMDADIVDSPVDGALAHLFKVIDAVDPSRPNDDTVIDGALGKQLFSLAKDILDSDVDLDLTWQRPKGSIRSTALSRAKARHLRFLLDRETTEDQPRSETGELASISTDGHIGLLIKGRKHPIKIFAEGFDLAALLPLWSKQVHARWIDSTVSHPQRDTKATTHKLVSIVPAEQSSAPALDE